MSETPRYTIAICTRNRADMLPASIRAAVEQAAPPAAYEILIIDNASTDNTAEIANDWVRQDARVRLVHEATPGLAVARNRALAEARGEIIIFVDDDATLCPTYLQTLHSLWEQEHPACAGGPIQITYLDPPPAGWSDAQEQFRGPLDYGTAPLQMHFSTYPEGCNIVFDRTEALAGGGFDTRFGPWPTGPWGGEETELCARLDAAGKAIWYHPDLRVTHRISRATRTKFWLLKMAFRRGQTYYYCSRSYYGNVSAFMFLRMCLRDTIRAFPWCSLSAWSRILLASGALYQALRTAIWGEWQGNNKEPL